MKKTKVIVCYALCLLLIGSVILNVVLFRKALTYYRQLHALHLDPIGQGRYRDVPAPDAAGRTVVVFVGDSRAERWSFPEKSEGFLFVDRAISGQTTAQILARMERDVLELGPDVVVIQAGVNDLKTIPLFPEWRDNIVSGCRSNLEEIVSLCESKGTTVIVTTIFPTHQPTLVRRPIWSADVDDAISEVNSFLVDLSSEKVVVLDSYELLLGEGQKIRKEFARDTLHLNNKGYRELNKHLVLLLEENDKTRPAGPPE